MNLVRGILLKLVATLMFAVMSALVRSVGETVPVGQVVFFRSAFAILPVVIIYALRNELWTAFHTARPFGHAGRGLIGVLGMFFNFGALARLPLAEVIAISFAAPLITVALAATVLRERVRIYRWSAVIVGFIGVIVMLTPHLDIVSVGAGGWMQAVGAALAVGSALCNSGAVIQTRRLTESETTSAIVLYFSLISTIGGAVTLPFAWHTPNTWELTALIATGIIGGVAHFVLTESYRYAPASLVAPFDYTMIVWAFILGYMMFGEVPTTVVLIGAAIVIGAGLFVIWRERQIGLRRMSVADGPQPPA